MALFEGKTPAERNKTIAALVLGVFAVIFLARMLFGGSSGSTQTARPTQTPRRPATQSASSLSNDNDAIDPNFIVTKIKYDGTLVSGAEAGRNIFAYYVPPVNTKPPTGLTPPPMTPATPTPTPPLVMAALTPASVYARTNTFTLQVAGDKFTPATRVYLDSQEVPTEFKSPQQLIANVPASLIAAAGSRQVLARTPDNLLFSNAATLNVMQPPVPTYTYVGYIARRRSEAAVLKNQKGELFTMQANDIVEGRFRITAISERSVDLVDKELSIKHSLPYVDPRLNPGGGLNPAGAISPPAPRSDEESEEEP